MSDTKESDASTADQPVGLPQKVKVKFDWYQTDAHITVNILIKNLDEDKIKVNFEEKCFAIQLPEELFNLNLSKAVVPSKCSYRVKPTKIELKLKKLNEDLWTNLEETKGLEVKEVPQPLTKRNWDKVVETELKDDASQGEAALNELFQKIYTDGTDEVKKAMNKSFLESGGTVLSTNWNEVGEKKVDIKPPDGMEWKKWDEQ